MADSLFMTLGFSRYPIPGYSVTYNECLNKQQRYIAFQVGNVPQTVPYRVWHIGQGACDTIQLAIQS